MPRWLAYTLLSWLAINAMPAMSQTGAIAGIVIDGDLRTPVSFVTVSVDGGARGTVSTEDGSFVVGNLTAGTHTLVLSRIGYASSPVLEVAVGADDTTEIREFLVQQPLISDEIVVSASRKSQTSLHAPATVSVVTQKLVEQRQIQTFDQAMDEVPGVVVSRSSGSNVQSLSIRGASETAGGGTGNRVLLLIDGRPALSPESGGALWNLVPLNSLERIEVVKGAYSSLFGSSAMGGVINAITRKPTYEPRTLVHLNYGFYAKPPPGIDYDNYAAFSTLQLSHSRRVGKFSYLFDIGRQHNDGHREKTEFTLYNIYGKVQYHFAPNRSLQFSANFNKINNDTPATWLSPSQPYEVAPYKLDDYQAKNEGSADLFYSAVTNSNLKYSSRFYYYQNAQEFTFNDDPGNDSTNVNTGKQFIDESSIDTWRIGNVSQVDWTIGNKHYLITGIDVKLDKVVALPDTVLYGRHRALEFGAFIQDEWEIVDELTLTAGIRYDYYEIINEHSEINISPKIALVYQPSNNIAIRGLYARAFRNPSIAERYIKFEQGGGLNFEPNPDLVSEKLIRSVELGTNFKISESFSADVALYYNKYEDLISFIQVSAPLEPLTFKVVNLKEAVMQGAEVQLGYRINQWVTLRGGYAYLDARDTSPDRFNDNLAYKPKHTYSASGEFTFKQMNLFVHCRGRSKLDEVFIYPDSKPDGFVLFDSRFEYDFNSRYSAYISVNNIGNTQYEEVERYRMPGRSYSVGFKLDL